MKLAAHHPSYLPSLAVFYKFILADIFIFADDYQYTTHNSINRTLIKTARGASWLTVPVQTKGRTGQAINSVEINQAQPWRNKHWRSLEINYIYAAWFEQYADTLELIYRRQWRRLVDLNLELFSFIKTALGIEKQILLSSDLSLQNNGSQRLQEMLELTGCKSYLADPDLAEYLNKSDFQNYGFDLQFIDFECPSYHQQFSGFISNLSCVDLLFNEGPDSRNILINSNK